MYVLDRCKTQETHDKVILENGGMLRFILDWYKNQKKKKKKKKKKKLMKLLILALFYLRFCSCLT